MSTNPAKAAPTAGSLAAFTLIMAGGHGQPVADFFRDMTEKERRAFVTPLKEHLKSVGWAAMERQQWRGFQDKRTRAGYTLTPAALAVFPGAATTAKFLRSVQRSGVLDTHEAAAIKQVLADRAPAWLPDLPAALLKTLDPDDTYRLVVLVGEVAGVRVPASPEFVRAWAADHSWSGDFDELRARILRDPRLPELLPLVFDDEANDNLVQTWAVFRGAAVEAVNQGLVSRAAMLDASLRRLLRGGRTGAINSHLAFWSSLEAADAEIVERVSSCISLLSSRNGSVARTFLDSLKKVSDAGLLDIELALEAASIAVTRPEKNVVKTTLSWLDALIATHPDRAAQIVGTVAIAFGAQAADLQERAVKLVGRHAKRMSEDERARLVADAQICLAPDLAVTLAGLLGVSQDSSIDVGGYPDAAAYAPRPLLPPIESPAELAEVIASLRQAAPVEAMVFERALEAIVSFARTDAEALREGLGPIIERWLIDGDWERAQTMQLPQTPRWALEKLVVAAGRPDDEKRRFPHRAGVNQLWSRVRTSGPGWYSRTRTSPADVLVLRLAEVFAALGMPDLPPLVAVPTAPTGAIDPEVLAARLRDCEARGLVPLEADFHQALLRLPDDCGDVDVTGFTSKAGLRFAAWVAGERVALPAADLPEPWVREQNRKDHRVHYLRRASREHSVAPKTLLDLVPGVWNEPERSWDQSDWPVCWPAIVPSRPDLAAWAMIGGVDWSTAQPSPEATIVLAEQDGPQDATHKVIAARLVHDDVRLRASGVDAALVLASRGLLDSAALGGALAAEIAASAAGMRRAVPALRDIANGGAAGQTWEAIVLMLPGILPPAVPKTVLGTADLLVLATELAGALTVRMPIAEVSALARKKGGSAAANAARRLEAVLHTE